MKVIVTGSAGFTGTCMMRFLSTQDGVDPTGFIRGDVPSLSGIPDTAWVKCDLLDKKRLLTTVSEICPDAIIHLAGLTHGTFDALLEANVSGTKNILDAGLMTNPECRMLVVSSSAVYGYPGNAAIPETTPQKPLSEYGVSKMAQDALALMYHQLRGSKVVVARPFNLTGPDQPGSFVCGRIVNQAAEIGQGKKPALELLEIRSSRDFLDVRDAVKGYWALVSHPEFLQECSGRAFNIGSGKACSISGLISLIEEITGKHYPVRLPPVPPRVPLLFQQSDNTRITATTGWTPRIPLKETLRDMLLAAERRISAG